MKRFMNKKALVVGVAVALVLGLGGAAFAYWTSSGGGTGAAQVGHAPSSVIITQDALGTPAYNSMISPMPPDTWSQAYEATGLTEFGNEITLKSGVTGALNNVVVALDSQACGNGSNTPCTTTPGATFALSMTLNVYNPASPVGAPIATDTQTFNIPFRPSASPLQCTAGTYNWSGYPNDGTQWYDAANGNCYYGINYAAVFDFSSQNITLPSTVVYGISFDASSGPAQSLNVMLSNESTNPTVGTDTDVGNVFAAGTQGDIGPGEITCSTLVSGFAQYSTAAGTNLSSPSPGNACGLSTVNENGTYANIPQVEFNLGGASDLSPGTSQPINFTITNPNTSAVEVSTVTIGIAQDPSTPVAPEVESTPGVRSSDVAGCYADWFSINGSPVTVNQSIPAGGSIDWVGAASITMANDEVNQDDCEGAVVGLTFTTP
ncbi:MAG: hypothetical protein ABSG36_09020 [Acidimicrobiales bacterium]|jgi:hypothetical protein